MSYSSKFIPQSIIPGFPSSIPLRRFPLAEATSAANLIRALDAVVLGVALQLSSKHATVEAVAFASKDRVFLIYLDNCAASIRSSAELGAVFSGLDATLAGFAMARIALDVHRDWRHHVRGVDLGTLAALSTMQPWSPSKFVSQRLYPDVQRDAIHALWSGRTESDLCLRAWISACLAECCMDEVKAAAKLDTQSLQPEELDCLGRLVHNVELLEAQRPDQMENEFENVKQVGDQLILKNARYNTRVRASEQTSIVMHTTHGTSVVARAIKAEGKQTTMKVLQGNHFRGVIERICVVGREESTLAEKAREEFLLLLLRRETSLESDFIQRIWFPALSAPSRLVRPKNTDLSEDFLDLNPSQGKVADAMTAGAEPLVIAHGPPGTGKTTTISAAVKHWNARRCPVWIVAQSNVGVKNIARSLLKHEIDFKLLVSKEFYLEWHEHIYGRVADFLIRSDDLFKDPLEAERMLGGSRVVLCTLSMLSNPCLDDCRLFDLVPFERLVVDEASQIDTSEFMHLFRKFRKTLAKVCLFGDPKQLPPFGKETAPDLQTIFDFKHLKMSAYFLDTQYRMPMPLGDFISAEVYNSKLRSKHEIKDMSCVAFVDVSKGEETKDGASWVNMEEVHAIVNLVRHYYATQEICIITPYDAQRGAIARALKTQNLPWECVYNVDSFQGHEARFVLVSTVRTAAAGFLHSRNRMNVMLTRCQRGMVVVTNRAFLRAAGHDTLLGRLAHHWARARPAAWTDARAVAARSADMPGAAAPAVSVAVADLAAGVRRLSVGPAAAPIAFAGGGWGGAHRARGSTGAAGAARAEAVPERRGEVFPALGDEPVRPWRPSGCWLSVGPAAAPIAFAGGGWGGAHRARGSTVAAGAARAEAVPERRREVFPALGDEPVKPWRPSGRWRDGAEAVKL